MESPSSVPSRPRTPSTVHHLLRPALTTSPSLVSLHAVARVTSVPTFALDVNSSSTLSEPIIAASVTNSDPGEGAISESSSRAEHGAPKDEAIHEQITLRLRRALTSGTTYPTLNRIDRSVDVPESHLDPTSRQYFVLTDAGKPVFVHRKLSPSSEDDTASLLGVMQAIISVFEDNKDKIRFVNSGDVRITFYLKPPLYFVCVGPQYEPEPVARSHLEYLHLQIISICSAAQIRKLFQRRANSDLQRLLDGTDSVIRGLLNRLRTDLGISFSSLVALRLDSSIRNKASEAIVPKSLKEILYTILIAKGKVITLVRPRKHSIHPADLHILLNTMGSPSLKAASNSASACWIPLCLPKYNPESFTHTYVSFINPEVGLSMICVCGASDFDSVQNWVLDTTKRMEEDGTLRALASAGRRADFSVAELGIPGLQHFVYKSKLHLQLTTPSFEGVYEDVSEQERLIMLYQILFDSVHAKSGQDGPLKVQYIQTRRENIMAWVTQPFELYLTLSPHMSKNAAVTAANSVVRWIRGEETSLFIKDAPVF